MINRKVEDTPVQCAVAVVELRNNIGDDPLQMPLVNLLPALRVHAVIVARASDTHSNNRVGSKGLKSGWYSPDHPTMYFVFSQPDGTLPTATARDRLKDRPHVAALRQPQARRASRPRATSSQTSHDAAFHHPKRRAPWERAKRQPVAVSPARNTRLLDKHAAPPG